MPESITIQCPHCDARLKLPDHSKIGKRVPCPKCKSPFVIKLPPEAEEFEDVDVEIEETAGTRPQRKSGKGAKSKKKSSKSKSSGPGTGVIVGCAVGLLVLIVGFATWSMTRRSPVPQIASNATEAKTDGAGQPEGVAQRNESTTADRTGQPSASAVAANKLDLSYLPADAEFFIHLKAGAVWGDPILQEFFQRLPDVTSFLTPLIPQGKLIEPQDIESVDVAINGDVAFSLVLQKFRLVQFSSQYVLVLKSRKDIDFSFLKLDETGEKSEHQGKTVYVSRSPGEKGKDREAICFPTPRTIIFAGESLMKGAISAGANPPPRADLAFIDPHQEFWMAAIPKPVSPLANLRPALFPEKTAGACVGLKFGPGIDVQLAVDTRDPVGAQKLQKDASDTIAWWRDTLQKGGYPPLIPHLSETLLGQANVTIQNDVVVAKFSLPESMRSDFVQLPKTLGEIETARQMKAAQGDGALLPQGTTIPAAPLSPPPPGAENLQTLSPSMTINPGVQSIAVMAVSKRRKEQRAIIRGTGPGKNLVIWDLAANQRMLVIEDSAPMSPVAMAPHGEVVAYLSMANELVAIEARSGNPIQKWKIDGSPRGIRFSSLEHVAVAGEMDKLRVVYPRNGDEVLAIPVDPAEKINCLSEIYVGTLGLFTGSTNGVIKSWDFGSGKSRKIASGDQTNEITCVAVDPDGKKLAAAQAGVGIKIIDLGNDNKLLRTIPASRLEDRVEAMVFLSDKKSFAYPAANNIIRIEDIQSGTPLFELQGHSAKADKGRITSLSFVPSESKIVSSSADGTINIWDVPLEADEAPGVSPASTEGLPNGLTLEARARKRATSGTGDQVGSNSLLEVTVDLSDAEATSKTIGCGYLKVKGAAVDGGKALQMAKPPAPLKDLSTEYLAVRNAQPGVMASSTRLRFFFDAPDGAVAGVSNFEGSFRIETFQESRERFEQISTLLKSPAQDFDLKAAGFRLKSRNEGRELIATVSPKYRLGPLQGYDSSSVPLAGAVSESGSTNEGPFQKILLPEGKIPESAMLRLSIYAGVAQSKPISFKFANIPITGSGRVADDQVTGPVLDAVELNREYRKDPLAFKKKYVDNRYLVKNPPMQFVRGIVNQANTTGFVSLESPDPDGPPFLTGWRYLEELWPLKKGDTIVVKGYIMYSEPSKSVGVTDCVLVSVTPAKE